jgi:ketosteroid isomerase-like protein
MVLLLLLAFGQTIHANGTKIVLAEVEAVSKAYDFAITQRDLPALESILAKAAVFTTATGRVMERAAVLEMLAKPDTHYESVESQDVVRRLAGNVVVETGLVKVRGKRKGLPIDEVQRYTDVWQKLDGRWRLIAEHTSLLAK